MGTVLTIAAIVWLVAAFVLPLIGAVVEGIRGHEFDDILPWAGAGVFLPIVIFISVCHAVLFLAFRIGKRIRGVEKEAK